MKYFINKLVALSYLILLGPRANADVSPYPKPHFVEVTNEDGQPQNVPILMKGNILNHWEEDEHGFPVMITTSTTNKTSSSSAYHAGGAVSEYVYAKLDEHGQLIPTDIPLGRFSNSDATISKFKAAGIHANVVPTMQCNGNFCKSKIASMSTRSEEEGEERVHDDGRGVHDSINTKSNKLLGTKKNLVVLMKFKDHETRTLPTKNQISILMNYEADGVTTSFHNLAPTGSVREHYLKSSHNQFHLDSIVGPWVTISKTEAECADGGSALMTDYLSAVCIKEALVETDKLIDFSQFDDDRDGYVDVFTVLHSGYGAEFGGIDEYGTPHQDRIWSHKYYISPQFESAEGIKVSKYHISPAVWSIEGNEINHMGTICHELGHFFGLPDMYDFGDGAGIGAWDLMAYSWGFDYSGYYPPPMSAWTKINMGWVQPTVISQTGTYTIGQSCSDTTIYKIKTKFPTDEYLLIENRQKSCLYDSQMGGSTSGGLAIWHIDDKGLFDGVGGYPGQEGWPYNNKHYRVALLQADGNYDLELWNNNGDAEDLYGPGQSLEPGNSHPNSNSYQYGQIYQTGITIDNIKYLGGGTMSFDLSYSSAPTSAPTPQSTCDGNSSKVRLEMIMDLYPSDITWFLSDKFTGKVIETEGPYDQSTDMGRRIVHESCVPKNICYLFTISDSWADGMYKGGYDLYYDSKKIMSYNDMTDMKGKEVIFGGECSKYQTSGWRIITQASNAEQILDIGSLEFYSSSDCSGSPDTTEGVIFDSYRRPLAEYWPGYAFESGGMWSGTANSFGSIFLGKKYATNVKVKCVRVNQPTSNYSSSLTVQKYQDGKWMNVGTKSGMTQGWSRLSIVENPTGYVMIKNSGTFCLHAPGAWNGASMVVKNCNAGSNSQKFRVDERGQFHLKVNDNKCIKRVKQNMVVGSCNGEIAATKFSVTAFGGGTFHWTQSGLLFTATLANDKAWNGAKVKLLGRNYSSKTQSQWEGEVEYSYNVK